ncbi:hypothetical protein JTE90_025791 [Oedothorax gibbosus]|uniref:Coiled-coil domain-containing protein 73 n=1 Tax=Oedothorax gibbosus TaxID=931172 RepID=A0AAV6V2J9_9ARAC|nr:hypothetical protein JTE90_025791 [Oedothorax gibbosus]
MNTLNFDKNGAKGNYDVLSFERKLVELVEELRLRRNLEIENEKNLKSLMDDKYRAEMEWDEKQSRHLREKDDLENKISILKRKLENKVCVSDDEKAKQQVVNKTYSQEIRVLKEELKNSISEKLKLVKRIQELEGQLKLHTNFQETIVTQITDIRKSTKNLRDDCQSLKEVQKSVLNNVTEVKGSFRKFEINHQHLKQCVEIADKNSEQLKKYLVMTRSEVNIYKNATVKVQVNTEKYTDATKLQNRISELDKLLLLSRKENQYSDLQEVEKSLSQQIKECDSKIQEMQDKANLLEDESIILKKQIAIENKRKEDRKTIETQTSYEIIDESIISRQPDSSSQIELAEIEIASKTCSLENIDSMFHNVENQASESPDVTEILISNPLQCSSTVRPENEQNIFETKGKRRFCMVEDDDTFNELPSKRRQPDTTLLENKSWIMNNRNHQNTMFDDIPSSANSVDDICQSQAISVAEDQAEPVGNQPETSELASVQMNLKGLKVDDVTMTSSQG